MSEVPLYAPERSEKGTTNKLFYFSWKMKRLWPVSVMTVFSCSESFDSDLLEGSPHPETQKEIALPLPPLADCTSPPSPATTVRAWSPLSPSLVLSVSRAARTPKLETRKDRRRAGCSGVQGTSSLRNCLPVRPYSRTIPRVIWCS